MLALSILFFVLFVGNTTTVSLTGMIITHKELLSLSIHTLIWLQFYRHCWSYRKRSVNEWRNATVWWVYRGRWKHGRKFGFVVFIKLSFFKQSNPKVFRCFRRCRESKVIPEPRQMPMKNVKNRQQPKPRRSLLKWWCTYSSSSSSDISEWILEKFFFSLSFLYKIGVSAGGVFSDRCNLLRVWFFFCNF